MTIYRVVLLIKQEASHASIEDIAKNLQIALEHDKGYIIEKKNLGLVTLSYIIKGSKSAQHFTLLIESNNLEPCNFYIKSNENIIRSLIMKSPKSYKTYDSIAPLGDNKSDVTNSLTT